MKEGYTNLSTRMSVDFADKVKKFAKDNDMNLSEVIRNALRLYMEVYNDKQNSISLLGKDWKI